MKEMNTSEEELIIEDEGAESDPKVAIKRLREKLRACEEEKKTYLDGWQRAKADYVNALREENHIRAEAAENGKEAVIKDLIKVADNFDRAMMSDVWKTLDPSWQRGVESIRASLIDVLRRYKTESFGEVGELFDPRLHNPHSAQKTADEKKDDTIAVVTEKGYKLGDKVIRPAGVVVNKFDIN